MQTNGCVLRILVRYYVNLGSQVKHCLRRKLPIDFMIYFTVYKVMLQKYKDSPWQNWRDKDTVLYLVTSLASKGQTQRHGITQTSQLVDLTSFTTEHVLPELQKDAGMS
jgi:hypothetical protein